MQSGHLGLTPVQGTFTILCIYILFPTLLLFPFRGQKVLSGGDCNNPENTSQFKIFKWVISKEIEQLK